MATRPGPVRLALLIATAVWFAATTRTVANQPERPTHEQEVEWFRKGIETTLKCPDLSREPGVFGDVEVTFKTRTKFTVVANAALGARFASCVAKAIRESERYFPVPYDYEHDRSAGYDEASFGEPELIVFSFGKPQPNLPEPTRLIPAWKTARRNDRPVRWILPPDITVTPEGCLLPASQSIRASIDLWLEKWSKPVSSIWWAQPQALLSHSGVPRLIDRTWLVIPQDKAYCLRPVDDALRAQMEERGAGWRGATADILLEPRTGFPTDRSYRSVSITDEKACAVDAAGAIVCCGFPRPPAPPKGAFKSVSVARELACAVRSDDAVVCWAGKTPGGEFVGRYAEVVVGDGSACARRLDDGRFECHGGAIDVSGDVRQLALGYGHCVLRRDGALDCGERGGTSIMPPPQPVIAVDRNESICALVEGGEAMCPESGKSGAWGLVSQDRFKDIATTSWGGCGRRQDDTVACWGRLPGPVPQGRFKALDGGTFHICGIRDDGRIACWGGHDNNKPMMGLGLPYAEFE